MVVYRDSEQVSCTNNGLLPLERKTHNRDTTAVILDTMRKEKQIFDNIYRITWKKEELSNFHEASPKSFYRKIP